MREIRLLLMMVVWGAAVCMSRGIVVAQQAEGVADGAAALNLPENLNLRVLVDLVGERDGINFIYDANLLGSRSVTIRAPSEIPADSIRTLLESVLRMNGLVITETEVPGMLRIQQAQKLIEVAEAVEGDVSGEGAARPTLVVTRMLPLTYIDAERAQTALTPYMSGAGANITPLAEHGMLVVTDYATNMGRIEKMLAMLDRPGRDVVMRHVQLSDEVDAEGIVERVNQLLVAKTEASRGAAAAGGNRAGGARVRLVADERSNRVAVIGVEEEVAGAEELIRSLDVTLGLETRVYGLRVASPDRIDQLVRALIGEGMTKRLYKSTIDVDGNTLIVTTTSEIHSRIETIRKELDKPIAESQSPIRFYKLENANVVDVLATLQSIEGEGGLGDVIVDGVASEGSMYPTAAGTGAVLNAENPRLAPEETSSGGFVGPVRPNRLDRSRGGAGDLLVLGETRVIADEPSNTIIIVTDPQRHEVYRRLIEKLDLRRPQVLIEAVVVTVDTTNDFSLGVEISSSESINGGEGTVLNFTSFGLSMVNPATGALALSPGVGFNGAVLGSDVADVIVRALESDSRARVVSRPSVLINDNAQGQLTSEAEEPFASVNASNTVATTSLGGFVTAGTRISVRPQISQGDHLKLEYEVELSSFEDAGTDVLPPSRLTNLLSSEVTIPNGYTIVVGGLTNENRVESVDRIPVLGSIPYLEYLFSNRSTMSQQTTLFVFIRAVVLRDDEFEDLKVLSRTASNSADLRDEYPESEPVELR